MGVATEADIRRRAARLYEAANATTPRLFDRKWWTGRLLEWAIRDDAFKVQLFRFIDGLPTLKTPSQIKRLVDEYFGQDSDLRDAPGWRSLMRWGMRALSSVGFGAGVTADTIYNQAIQMANQFIVGAGMKEALPAVADLWKRGIVHSVDLLGEATVCEPEAVAYAARYHEAITALAEAAREWRPSPLLEADHLGPLPRAQVSIKLSALDSQFDPIDPEGRYAAVAARLRPLLRAAMQHGEAVTFDMEHYEWKDLTLWIVRRLLMEDEFRSYPLASLALQAYLKDTERDVRELLAWAEAQGGGLAAKVMELQMLYGMAEPLQSAVVDAGYRLRVYAPVGDLIPGMAYLVRRLLENTANESILRRQFLGNQSLDELLRPPTPTHPSPLKGEGKLLPSPLAGEGEGEGGSASEFTNEPHTDFSRAEARERM